MKKSERLKVIKNLVSEYDIETQYELLKMLKERGVSLTQATISRDMNEIGIIKLPSENGNYIYGVSQDNAKSVAQPMRAIKSTVLSVSDQTSGLEQMLHLEVIPGNSRLIKRYLLEDFRDSIFSIIADDDSLLLIAKTSQQADVIRQHVEGWMKDGQ